jgi:predicted nucleic acid-binding protein
MDGGVADACGHLLARTRQAGRGLGAIDGLISATCSVCGLVPAARNLDDIDGSGVELYDVTARCCPSG